MNDMVEERGHSFFNDSNRVTSSVALTQRSMKTALRVHASGLAVTAFMFAAGVPTFGAMFYHRYWRWRDCFNNAGVCYFTDSSGESHIRFARDGAYFGTLTGVCVTGAVILALLAWRAFRRSRAPQAAHNGALTAPVDPAIGAAESFSLTKQVGPPPLLSRSQRHLTPPRPHRPH